jgi:hypothetical protein
MNWRDVLGPEPLGVLKIEPRNPAIAAGETKAHKAIDSLIKRQKLERETLKKHLDQTRPARARAAAYTEYLDRTYPPKPREFN